MKQSLLALAALAGAMSLFGVPDVHSEDAPCRTMPVAAALLSPYEELERIIHPAGAKAMDPQAKERHLGEVLDAAVRLIQAETGQPLQRLMAARLYTAYLGLSPESLAEAGARLPQYVPILALGGDPTQAPSIQAVPRSHFL